MTTWLIETFEASDEGHEHPLRHERASSRQEAQQMVRRWSASASTRKGQYVVTCTPPIDASSP